jgi:hypothetical protein
MTAQADEARLCLHFSPVAKEGFMSEGFAGLQAAVE